MAFTLSFAFCSGSFPMRQTPFSQRKTPTLSFPRSLHTSANDITERSAQSGGCCCVINRNFPIYYTCSIRHNFAYIYSSYSNLPDNTDTDVILCYLPLFTQRPFSGIYPWGIGLLISFRHGNARLNILCGKNQSIKKSLILWDNNAWHNQMNILII